MSEIVGFESISGHLLMCKINTPICPLSEALPPTIKDQSTFLMEFLENNRLGKISTWELPGKIYTPCTPQNQSCRSDCAAAK
jgi:hypothetical protein